MTATVRRATVGLCLALAIATPAVAAAAAPAGPPGSRILAAEVDPELLRLSRIDDFPSVLGETGFERLDVGQTDELPEPRPVSALEISAWLLGAPLALGALGVLAARRRGGRRTGASPIGSTAGPMGGIDDHPDQLDASTAPATRKEPVS